MAVRFALHDTTTADGRKLAIVAIGDRLDSTNSLEWRSRLQQIVDFGYPNILLDLGQLQSFDSSGLGVVIATLRKCRAARGNIAFFAAPDIVVRTLEISGTDAIVRVFPDETSAIADFPPPLPL